MHEIYLFKVPEILDIKAFIAPITIMTRSPVVCQMYPLLLVYKSLFTNYKRQIGS